MPDGGRKMESFPIGFQMILDPELELRATDLRFYDSRLIYMVDLAFHCWRQWHMD